MIDFFKFHNPFPLSDNDYDIISISKFEIRTPISKGKPFIFIEKKADGNDNYVFIYCDNPVRISNEFIHNFENFNDIENIIDLAKFTANKSGVNFIKFNNNYSEIAYYGGENQNKILRFLKSDMKNGINNINWVFDIWNQYKNKPIQKKVGDNITIESFYYIDPIDDNLYSSFPVNDDKPFIVTKKVEHFNYCVEHNYLIPFFKTSRAAIYKPSMVKFVNNNVVSFEYMHKGKDFTGEAISILKELNIRNPVNHVFSDTEIEFFKERICQILD